MRASEAKFVTPPLYSSFCSPLSPQAARRRLVCLFKPCSGSCGLGSGCCAVPHPRTSPAQSRPSDGLLALLCDEDRGVPCPVAGSGWWKGRLYEFAAARAVALKRQPADVHAKCDAFCHGRETASTKWLWNSIKLE